jgi:arginine exporter protein ArgO
MRTFIGIIIAIALLFFIVTNVLDWVFSEPENEQSAIRAIVCITGVVLVAVCFKLLNAKK